MGQEFGLSLAGSSVQGLSQAAVKVSPGAVVNSRLDR